MLNAQAALNAVDPGPYLDGNGGFPVWYQDSKGLGLDLCLSQATIAAGAVPGGAGGAACVLAAEPEIFDPTLPIVFPATSGACPSSDRTRCNFPGESFWFMGGANFTAGGVDVLYEANLEAAFVTEVPARGGQISFARIRIRITLPGTAPAGNYTVTHPYGVDVFNVTGGGVRAINSTVDVGIAPGGIFTGALGGAIGPFLMDASVPANGFIPSSVPGEFYVGDPNTARPVVGSPFGTNFVRVDGPAGFTPVSSTLFTVMGKVHAGALATPLLIERTTYARRSVGGGSTEAQQDVFVTAPPAPQHVVSAIDANGAAVTMTDNDANGAWYGQSAGNATGTSVTVTAAPAPGGPPNTPTTASKALTDVVTIKRAEYSLSTHTLTVEAASSDEVPLPLLTVNGQSLTPTGVDALQSVTLGGLVIPPATVTVTSANGGSDTELVVLLP